MPETTASSSTISGGVWTVREDGRSAGVSARSSARARRKRLRRTSQLCPPLPSSTADIVPPLEVQPQLANTQGRKRECEGQDVIEQPEDQKTGKQLFGIVLPQRNQHRRVEHTEPAGRMAGKAEQRRSDKNHRDVD